MDFLEAFENIDTNYSGEITQDELVDFMKKKDYDDKFVQKWLRLFDSNGDGSISIDEYCEVLGLVPRDEYLEKVSSNKQHATIKTVAIDGNTTNEVDSTIDLMSKVRTILVADEMSQETRQMIAKLAHEAQTKCSNEFEMAKYIKENLDEKIERYWHVIVCRFNHASFVGFEVGCVFHFYLLRYSFFVWKTPYY